MVSVLPYRPFQVGPTRGAAVDRVAGRAALGVGQRAALLDARDRPPAAAPAGAARLGLRPGEGRQRRLPGLEGAASSTTTKPRMLGWPTPQSCAHSAS